MRGLRLPGDGAKDGLLAYLLERLVQMPYLWLIWVIVLLTCYAFVSLDQRSATGRQQTLYGLSLLVVLALYGSEMHSIGYYAIWVLGILGLIVCLAQKYFSEATVTR